MTRALSSLKKNPHGFGKYSNVDFKRYYTIILFYKLSHTNCSVWLDSYLKNMILTAELSYPRIPT